MSDIIILMRHGKAERPEEGMADADRELTKAGMRSLAATLPNMVALMPRSGESIALWSSPAVRALQTAALFADACEVAGVALSDDIEPVEELWTQDADAFLKKARSCASDAIVAVGHNPFIEETTARLTGSQIDFATGGFAAIQLGDTDDATETGEAPGRLLWFAQGPVSQRWKTTVQMERVLAESADTVGKRLEAFFSDPDDIETMHKFRVSIRTLRSLVAFVAPWQNQEQNKAVQADLKAVVAETSRLRELDVLSEQAADMEGRSEELVAFCASAAQEERERVAKVLASRRTAKRLERVRKNLHNVKWRKGICLAGLDARDVRERFDGLAENLQAQLGALDIVDAEETHDVRKKAKRIRYDAERFGSLIGDDAVSIAKGMTAHQDNLGAICDARVNIDILNGFADQELPERVAWDLALLRARNETFLYTTLAEAANKSAGAETGNEDTLAEAASESAGAEAGSEGSGA